MAQLKALEHEGDHITRQIFDALNSTFITPLDREDIRSLATDLDDILDYLEGVAQYLVLFELAESPEALRQFAEILVAMVERDRHASRSLIWDLANEKQDPRGDRAHLRAREPGRRPLQHGDRRPLQGQGAATPSRS